MLRSTSSQSELSISEEDTGRNTPDRPKRKRSRQHGSKRKETMRKLCNDREFPFLRIVGGQLECSVCRKPLCADSGRIRRHAAGKKHKGKMKQRRITDGYASTSVEDRYVALCRHLMEHNIPLYSIDNLFSEDFISLLMNILPNMPSGDTLRKTYMERAIAQRTAEIAESIFGKRLSLLFDESSDRFKQYPVLLVSIASYDSTVLGSARVESHGESMTGEHLSTLVEDTLGAMGVSSSSVEAVVTDNGANATKASGLLQEKWKRPDLAKLTCLCHSMNLVAEAYTNASTSTARSASVLHK